MEHNDLACIHAGSFPISCKSGIPKFPINLYCGMLDSRCSACSSTSNNLSIGTWINWLFNTRIRKCWAMPGEICRIQLLPHDHNPIVWTMRPAWVLYHTWQAPAKLIHGRSWLDKEFWRVVIYEMSAWCACPGKLVIQRTSSCVHQTAECTNPFWFEPKIVWPLVMAFFSGSYVKLW